MTFNALMKAVRDRQCIVWFSGRHMPAAFLIGMPFRDVVNSLPRLSVYRKKKGRRPHRTKGDGPTLKHQALPESSL